jgi:VIT1/CCC1 family predicted Fe2+/Mn2+ transporter
MPMVPAQLEPHPWLTLILAVALGAILLFAVVLFGARYGKT